MKALLIPALLGIVFLLTNNNLAAQIIAETTISLKVDGICGQCTQRIEAAAKGKGVMTAKWDVATKLLLITHNASRTTVEQIQERIAGAGHDT